MDIMQLDEAQGLTAEMVRKHIARLGYSMRKCPEFPVCKSIGRHTHHGAGEIYDFTIPDEWAGNSRAVKMLECALGLLSALSGYSLQTYLREMNPRMRPWPSEAAIEAHEKHGGRWLASEPTGRKEGVLVHGGEFGWGDEDYDAETERLFLTGDDARDEEECEGWLFWPIDKHGNKTRWPERDGVML